MGGVEVQDQFVLKIVQALELSLTDSEMTEDLAGDSLWPLRAD